ncbi:MAG TPA: complex I NDUFA9 subunit family protein [Usitatibacter sp.]|jgi:NADH dehydrogenase|nr:complex I NDUFA9 subunit family protein [Usitatibacter sp.]
MEIASVCLLGGTGFVGTAIADLASQGGARIRVLTRSLPRARHLTVLPTVELMLGDPSDEKTLEKAFEGMDAVVNLVGILHEGRQDFSAVHAELPRKVARACRAGGVQHLVHVSALGASEKGPSRYLRSKAAGEAAVRLASSELAWTILRPSVIFGEGDRFLNLFATLARLFPAIPLAKAGTRFQPIWVEDVARCCVAALGNPAAFGQAFDLCGPRVYTLEELVRLVAATLGLERAIVPLPDALAKLQAMILEVLPGKLMTRDNLLSMSVASVCSGRAPAFCAFEPAAIEAVIPEYMGPESIGARYARYRAER